MLVMHSPPSHQDESRSIRRSRKSVGNGITLNHMWASKDLDSVTTGQEELSGLDTRTLQPQLIESMEGKCDGLDLSLCSLPSSQGCIDGDFLAPPLIFSDDIVPETPIQSRSLVVKLKLSSGLPNCSLGDIEMTKSSKSPAQALHPFFLGKKALESLNKSTISLPSKGTLEVEAGPPRKRRKSKDSQNSICKSPTATQSSNVSTESKPLHPFFTLKNISDSSVESLGLPGSLKNTSHRLAGGIPAPFPNPENMHVRGPCSPTKVTNLPLLEQVDRKGKHKETVILPQEYVINKLATKLHEPEKYTTRYPNKIFCNPSKIQTLADNALNNSPDNPKLCRVYSSLPLPKLQDHAHREVHLWTYKYAPIMSSEILQPNQHPLVLKTWLQRLQLGTKLNRRVIAKNPKKLSMYDIEMQDFVVEDDEIEDSEDDEYFDKPKPKNPQKVVSKTLDRSNYIVLDGPHGVGKTASVYACAYELGFEVFEVYPGSRRCGKDVLDQVGEIAQSHLIGSGKQSLILIEEVDVLFEEDKGFWNSVLELIEKSRRPVVLTCNDIGLLAEELDPRTVLTYAFPPTELSVDYLHILCLNEGHLISPDVILKLFLVNGSDLRKTISQLQFWCQMGVGSDVTGTNWFPTLYIEGDETKRVISCETYSPGMEFHTDAEPIDGSVLERLYNIHVFDKPPRESKHNINVLCALERYLETISFIDGELNSERTLYTPHPNPDKLIPANTGSAKFRPQKLDTLQGYTHLEQLQSDLAFPFQGELSVSYKLFKTAISLLQYEIATLQDTGVTLIETDETQMFEILAKEQAVKDLDISEIYPASFESLSRPSDWTGPQFPHNITLLPLRIFATEVACYIRSIILTDQEIEKEISKRSSLLALGGESRKRHTRAAKAAEGIGRRRKRLHLNERNVLVTWDL